MLIPTSVYGTNGPGFTGPIAFEDPNIPGVCGVGFDVWPNNTSETDNDISVHWDNAQDAAVSIPKPTLTFASGSFHRAAVTIRHLNGGALVTVTLIANVNGSAAPVFTPITDLFVPGLNPISCRVQFAGRTGALDTNIDLDNINVRSCHSV